MDDLGRALNHCYRHELTMMVRYLNFSIRVTGLDRLHLAEFFARSAEDSKGHAAKVGLKILGLGLTPQGKIAEDLESVPAGAEKMLEQALKDEEAALSAYAEAVGLVKKDLALREMLVHILKDEQSHIDELRMILKK